jgi:trans-2,3-dihydro-3-hydroxyanthranilate isomerase
MLTRRDLMQSGLCGLAVTGFGSSAAAPEHERAASAQRRFQFVQIDVFTSQRLQGNPLAVFPDATGLSDAEMQSLARETNLQETTFVLPRDAQTERAQGIKVRIFIPDQEIPFGGHPTLGTATVLRNRLGQQGTANPPPERIVLDLKAGRIPVVFRSDAAGNSFGDMHQVEPVFGPVHDRDTVARIIGVGAGDISDEGPIQRVSTGLPFVIVPLRKLATLESLRPDLQRERAYFEHEPELTSFYYVCRETGNPAVGLRSRAIYPDGEDPATGSAAGCTAAWMVRHGLAESGRTVHIEQGVEIHRPSHLFVRAERAGEKVRNVVVGGNAVEIAAGEYHL